MKVTRAQIIELSEIDPIVGSVIRFWHRGELTWTEMMEVCVSHLVKQNTDLRKEINLSLVARPRIEIPKI